MLLALAAITTLSTYAQPSSNKVSRPGNGANASKDINADNIQMKEIKGFGSKVFNVADINDNGKIYEGLPTNEKNCFFVISKKEFRIYVYEATNGDTTLVAHFPICYAKRPGKKTKTGDMSTPECENGIPFTISQIQDASTWRHDFKDGRGNILAYGPYFMRLKLTGSVVPGNNSIGIHGCGGTSEKSNHISVPGRDSEGCIRLRDADLKLLRPLAHVGTKVFIKPATGKAGDKYGYEIRAMKKCKDYQPATFGNPNVR